MTCTKCHKPSTGKRCDRCRESDRKARQRARDRNPEGYTPLDHLLALPRVRLLRAMRWFDWCSMAELCIALDVPTYDARQNSEYLSLWRGMRYLVERGLVERQRGNGGRLDYRLTGAGRERSDALRYAALSPHSSPPAPGFTGGVA